MRSKQHCDVHIACGHRWRRRVMWQQPSHSHASSQMCPPQGEDPPAWSSLTSTPCRCARFVCIHMVCLFVCALRKVLCWQHAACTVKGTHRMPVLRVRVRFFFADALIRMSVYLLVLLPSCLGPCTHTTVQGCNVFFSACPVRHSLCTRFMPRPADNSSAPVPALTRHRSGSTLVMLYCLCLSRAYRYCWSGCDSCLTRTT